MDVEVGGFLNQSIPYDYPDDYEYKDNDDIESKRFAAAVLIPVLYSFVLVVGLLGNTLLLFVLFKKRRYWRISDNFILSLVVADVLLLLTLPFWAAQAAQPSGWCFGAVFCKICGVIFNINFYCGIFVLVCLCLDHYLSIIRSTQLYSHKKPILVRASCFLVWFIPMLLTIPDWIFLVNVEDTTQAKTLCVHKYSVSVSQWPLWPRLLHHIVGLLLPAAILIFCCSCILLQWQRKSKDPKKPRAVTILLLVVVFFIWWMPYNITLIMDTYRKSSRKPHGPLKTALMVTSALGCVHACLRPMLYFFLCKNFRKWTLALLRCDNSTDSKPDFKSSLWELGVGEEPLPDQNHQAEELHQMKSEEHQSA